MKSMVPLGGAELRAQGMDLVDKKGRRVFFSGINLVHKGKRLEGGGFDFYGRWDEGIYEKFAGMGFNLLRFGILWAAMEPRPGEYDMDYFAYVRGEMDKAAACGLSVVLDMHQDLYAQRYSDGAPDWAVLTQHPFEATELWSDAYLFSPAVHECWDSFWQNKKPEGSETGLQDHYAALWRKIAQYFGGHPALLGYDILNEPAPGSEIQGMFALVLESLAGQLTAEETAALGLSEPSAEALVEVFLSPEKKLMALEVLNDPQRYRQLGELCKEPVMAFERGPLAAFYAKVAAAIRSEDTQSFILRGNNYMSNIGIPSGIPPITVGGKPDPRQILAPHGYDLTVDTPAIEVASDSRAGSIFARHRETQQSLNLPLIVGEWGAFGQSGAALRHGRSLQKLFDSCLWGNTYWCYEDGLFDFPVFRLLKRPRPVLLSGRAEKLAWDAESGLFELVWQEEGAQGAESLVFLHSLPLSAELDGEAFAPAAGLTALPFKGGLRRLSLRFPADAAG